MRLGSQGLFLPLLLTLSLALNVTFGWVIRGLRQDAVAVRAAGFHAGDSVAAMPTIEGTNAHASFNVQRPTLLYVFSPQCKWCDANYANMRAVYEAANSQYDFVGVTQNTTGLDEYLKRQPFPGRVIVADGSRLPAEQANDLGVTPQLLVVDQSGAIQRAWAGALFGAKLAEAEAFFKAKLPGVAEVPDDTTAVTGKS
jgi:hypothetical protein